MTTTAAEGGGFINSLLGGVAGTLAGTNPLQSSIDQLTNAVNRLSTQMSMGGSLNGGSVRNQQSTAAYTNTRFPAVNVPGINRQPGIGGGGPLGTGNITQPMPFTRMGAGVAGGFMLGSGLAGYGQQQMPFQIGLNAMATMSMMGMSGVNNGMGNYSGQFTGLINQPGMPITSGSMDYLSMIQRLQFLGGSPMFMSSALGRAGFGAASAFGMTNPTLSGAAAGSLAQQVYNPMLSMRMRLLGYSMTPRVMGSGMPQSIGNIAASLIQGWYGRSKVNPAQLYRTLSMGGKGFTNLEYLGLNPQQMAPLLEGFNQLFNAGYSPSQASNLFTRAASNNPSVSRPAQAQLTRAGVRTVSSDIQKIRNNQAQLTQRSVNTAAGFDAALTNATDALQKFNQMLNTILDKTGLNGPLGAAGGFFGTLAGTNHGNSLLGLGGLALMARGIFGGGAGLFGGGGAASGAAGGLLARLGLGGAGGLVGGATAGAALYGLSKVHNPNGTNWLQQGPGGPGSGWNSWSALGHNISNWGSDIGGTLSRIFGGATSAPSASSSQQGSRSSTTSNISSSAFKAVTAAESQLGVPYVWGGEQPGVGFDCSGLIQWAYKQAGVALPRTSEQQWSALKRRSIPTNQVQEGDLVFMAGADGTPNNPGHVGMMINKSQLIEAPTTGQDVKIIGYDPKQWSHAARPSGRMNLAAVSSNQTNVGASSLGLYGNMGIGMGIGNYGSANEVDLISSTGGFMGGGVGAFSLGGLGGLMSTGGGTGNGRGSKGPMGNGSKQISAEKAYAMQLLRARGWGSQFSALNSIIMAESSWRWNATNPTSGAYGIPQALPGSKMSAAGKDWRTNPDTQLRWLVDMYIPQRYGNPNNAWAFHQTHGWYGGGGWANQGPGVRVVGDRGPEMQIDTGHGTLTINNSQTMSLLKAISNPQQTPWQNFTESNTAGQTIYPGMSTGAKVNVTFGKQSICINVSSTTDAQTAGQTLAKEIVNSIHSEQLWSAIAKGQKN